MKQPLLWIAFCILFTFPAEAQMVKVLDEQTGKPISNVLIYNQQKSQSVLTNRIGQASLKGFTTTDSLFFQHSSYFQKKISFSSLEALKFKVALNERFINLNEVLISANKWEETRSEIPNHIEVIKSKSILLNAPATSADLISDGQQIFVQKSQLGGGSPMIRGFAANKILLVVDGIRMNNAIYRSGNLQNILQADVNSISSAEVIFGPGTNIYGSDALGGVIDLHLMNPFMNVSKGWAVHGHAYGRFGSAATEQTGHVDVNIANQRWAFLTSVSYTKYGDLRMGKTGNDHFKRYQYVERINGTDSIVPNTNPYKQVYSGYNQKNFIQKIKFNLNQNSQLNVGFYYSATSDVPRYDRLFETSGGHLKYAQWYYRPQTWMMTRLGLNLHKKTKAWDAAAFTIAYQDVQEGRNDRKYRNNWLRQRKEQVGVVSLNADFNKKMSKNQFIYYGLSIHSDHVNSTGISENITTGDLKPVATRYPDGGSQTFNSGIYLTYKKNLQKIPLTLLAGARASYATLSSKFIDTSYYHLPYTSININNRALTGSAGIIYHPGRWQFRLNLSSGFRAPNLDDVAKVFDSEPGSVVVPNENLRPEYIYSGDLGIRKGIGDIADIEVSLFYSHLKDAMVRRDFQLNGQDSIYYDGTLSKVQAIVNAGFANIYGISFEGDIQVSKNIGLRANLTYIKGKDDEGFTLSHIPPFYGGGSVYFEKNKWRILLNVRFNGTLTYTEMSPSEQAKVAMYTPDAQGNPYAPGWMVLNLKGTYAVSEHFLFTWGIENITDHSYRPYASGISAPGRNFITALRYSF